MNETTTVAEEYAAAWATYVAGSSGPVPGSVLSEPEETAQRVRFLVRSQPGTTYETLVEQRCAIAAALGVEPVRVLFERPDSAGEARLTIAALAAHAALDRPRLYGGPQVQDGQIVGVGRYIDGDGELSLAMWRGDRTVPTAIVGDPHTGRSTALRIAALAAARTGTMHTLFVDPTGCADPVLRRRARIALVGEAAAKLALPTLNALVRARANYVAERELVGLAPTGELGGWLVAIERFGSVVNPHRSRRWQTAVTVGRGLGLWPVAVAYDLSLGAWKSDELRQAFSEQVLAFRDRCTTVPPETGGLAFPPRELPASAQGRPVPGYVTVGGSGRAGVPVRLDWLPERSTDPTPRPSEGYADKLFRSHSQEAELADVDRSAISTVLGRPVNGRWDVGPGGTHEIVSGCVVPRTRSAA